MLFSRMASAYFSGLPFNGPAPDLGPFETAGR